MQNTDIVLFTGQGSGPRAEDETTRVFNCLKCFNYQITEHDFSHHIKTCHGQSDHHGAHVQCAHCMETGSEGFHHTHKCHCHRGSVSGNSAQVEVPCPRHREAYFDGQGPDNSKFKLLSIIPVQDQDDGYEKLKNNTYMAGLTRRSNSANARCPTCLQAMTTHESHRTKSILCKTLRCVLCQTLFNCEKAFQEHVSTCQGCEYSFKCVVMDCSSRFREARDLYLHVRTAHVLQWELTGTRQSYQLFCPICLHVFNNSAILEHLHQCMKKQIHFVACTFLNCHDQFTTADALLHHLQSAHNTAPFHDISSGVFDAHPQHGPRHETLQSTLMVHAPGQGDIARLFLCAIQRSTSHLSWPCLACRSSFGTRYDFSRHTNEGSSCRKLQCEHCLKLYRQVTELHDHQLTPAMCKKSEQFVICEFCDVKFREENMSWKQHQAAHDKDQRSIQHFIVLSPGEHASITNKMATHNQLYLPRILQKVHSHLRCHICMHMLHRETLMAEHLSSCVRARFALICPAENCEQSFVTATDMLHHCLTYHHVLMPRLGETHDCGQHHSDSQSDSRLQDHHKFCPCCQNVLSRFLRYKEPHHSRTCHRCLRWILRAGTSSEHETWCSLAPRVVIACNFVECGASFRDLTTGLIPHLISKHPEYTPDTDEHHHHFTIRLETLASCQYEIRKGPNIDVLATRLAHIDYPARYFAV